MTKARDIATSEVITGEIGSTIQAYDADLDSIAALDKTDGNVIVGDGTNWVAESGATARTSLGLGTAATTNSTDYATAAQGALADSALQSIAAGSIGTTELANNAVTSAKLDTNISVPGTVTATSFVGSGASLTGIAGGFSNLQVFTSPGTWTNPGNVTKVKVTVVGGGGGATISTENTSNSGNSGGTSSFGAYCSATGGTAGGGTTNRKQTGGIGGIGSGGQLNMRGGMGLGTMNSGQTSFAQGGSTFVGMGAEMTGTSQIHGPYSAAATYGGGATVTAFAPNGGVYFWESGCSGGGGGTAIEVIPFPSATNVPITIGSGGNSPVVGPIGAPPAVTTQNAAAGVVIVEY